MHACARMAVFRIGRRAKEAEAPSSVPPDREADPPPPTLPLLCLCLCSPMGTANVVEVVAVAEGLS